MFPFAERTTIVNLVQEESEKARKVPGSTLAQCSWPFGIVGSWLFRMKHLVSPLFWFLYLELILSGCGKVSRGKLDPVNNRFVGSLPNVMVFDGHCNYLVNISLL